MTTLRVLVQIHTDHPGRTGRANISRGDARRRPVDLRVGRNLHSVGTAPVVFVNLARVEETIRYLSLWNDEDELLRVAPATPSLFWGRSRRRLFRRTFVQSVDINVSIDESVSA